LNRLMFLLSLSLIVSTSSFAADPPDSFYPSKVRLLSQISTEGRKSFYIDYLFPLFYSEDKTTLLFFNPKQTWHDPSSDERNLGLGIRKAFRDSFILGVHCFYDRKKSTTNAVHFQRGYGAEYLSELLDVRFNYYDPINKPRVVEEGYEFGETGILQWNALEEPLEGFDFEVGVPLIPRKLSTRLYVGGFFYDSKLVEDVKGVRVRTETNFADWLSLDLTLDSKNQQETNFTAGLRVTVPLELGRVLKKENPLKTQKLPYWEDRLFERVVRDIDVQTSARAVKVSSPATLTIGQGVVVGNMIFVDNSRSPGGNGSVSRPYNTLANAFADPRFGEGICIFIFKGDGTATGYTGHYTISSEHVTIWGDGYSPVMGCGGGGFPVIDGNNTGNVFTVSDNNTIMGLQIQNGDTGIYGENVEGIVIKHNVITGHNVDGVGVYSSGGNTLSATISQNTITDNNYGIVVETDGSSTMTATISNNTITGSTNDAIFYGGYSGTASTTLTVSGNTINDNNYAIDLISWESSNLSATISGNTMTGNDKDGITMGSLDDSTMSVTVSGNTMTANGRDGLWMESWDNSVLSVSASRNTITGNLADGVYYIGALTTNPVMDIGGGALGSAGRNSIYNNTDSDVDNDDPAAHTIMAKYNWWGQAVPAAGEFSGAVDYSGYLTSSP